MSSVGSVKVAVISQTLPALGITVGLYLDELMSGKHREGGGGGWG